MEFPEDEGPAMPVNETPEAVINSAYSVLVPLQKYGWLILLGLVVLYYLWQRVKPNLMKKWQDHLEYVEEQSKDPEKVFHQQEAMERARRRMQEIQDAESARYKEKQLQLEEKRRREKIKDWERHLEGKGYRSKMKKPSDDAAPGASGSKPKPKPKSGDFNPLMGSCNRPSYRPGRRDVSGGG